MFWYNDEVSDLEKKVLPPKGAQKRLVFYGSSSLRMWDNSAEEFPQFEIINRAFGGSTIAACCCFFDRLIPITKPDLFLFYAGDNDLGFERHPEELLYCFKVLMEYLEEHCGEIPIGVISIKPSFAHKKRLMSIQYTNQIIKQEIRRKYSNCTYINVFDDMLKINQTNDSLFEEDGLHLSSLGYQIWKDHVEREFLRHYH